MYIIHYTYAGVGNSRFTVVIQINNTRINSVSHTQNCKPNIAPPPVCDALYKAPKELSVTKSFFLLKCP